MIKMAVIVKSSFIQIKFLTSCKKQFYRTPPYTITSKENLPLMVYSVSYKTLDNFDKLQNIR